MKYIAAREAYFSPCFLPTVVCFTSWNWACGGVVIDLLPPAKCHMNISIFQVRNVTPITHICIFLYPTFLLCKDFIKLCVLFPPGRLLYEMNTVKMFYYRRNADWTLFIHNEIILWGTYWYWCLAKRHFALCSWMLPHQWDMSCQTCDCQ